MSAMRDGLRDALRVLVVDDEALSRLRLRDLVADCVDPVATVVGEVGTAAAALQWLSQHRAEVVLLDIHMPGLDGLALAERLQHQARPLAIIFVTAHAEHALAAFDVEAVDYLTKPVRRGRLQTALQRAVQRLYGWSTTQAALLEPLLTQPGGLGSGAGDWGHDSAIAVAGGEPAIVVHERGELLRVPLAEVLYLKAELKYVTLRTARRFYLLDESLAELEPRVGDRFIRVHRNALVAKTAIVALERRRGSVADERDSGTGDGTGESVEGWAVRIAATDEWLAVSRRQLALVREMLTAEGW